MASPPVISNATCLGCGCTCDDIEIVLDQRTILDTRNACAMGARWFGTGGAPARARVNGADVSLEDAVQESAAVLTGARRALVLLGTDLSCETYREVVACADLLRARLDIVPRAVTSAALAIQERGIATATLGEIRNRADVILFWGVDPSIRYPRYESRYLPHKGRASRTVIAVDVDESRGPADADVRVDVAQATELDTLVALASLMAGATAPTSGSESDRLVWRTASTLADLLREGRYVVVVADADSVDDRSPGCLHRVLALGHALNVSSRGAVSLLRGAGNLCGADAVMTRQTGYPGAVDFASGVPRYRPHAEVSTAAHDAVLLVGSFARSPFTGIEGLDGTPTIAIGPHASDGAPRHARVVIDSATAGIHSGGEAVRMDDVPIPLAALVSGPPDATLIVTTLRERLQQVRA